MKDLKLGVVESQYFLSPCAAVFLFIASIMTELSDMQHNNAIYILYNHLNMFILAGILGILVNYLTVLVIQLTSSLNVKILVMLRNILLIIVSVVFYGESISNNEVLGYGIAIIGFVM